MALGAIRELVRLGAEVSIRATIWTPEKAPSGPSQSLVALPVWFGVWVMLFHL